MRETMKVKRNSYKLFSHFCKIRRMRFAFFILLLSLEMICPAVTFAEHIAMIHSQTEAGTTLYSARNGDAVGYYFNYLPVEILTQYGDFSFVRIRDEYLSVEGYMQSRDLSADLDMNREVLNIHVGTVLHESKAVLRERPDSNSLEVGRLPKGSKIKIIGKYKNFFHVYHGDRYCFVLCEAMHLSEDSVIANPYGGVPEIGYLFPKRKNTPILRSYPSFETPVEEGIEMFYFYPQRPLEVIADLGEWFQVRIMQEQRYYYIPKAEVQQVVMLSDWFLNEDVMIPAGRYRAGEDIKAGLYTYVLAEGQAGVLRIDTADTQYGKEIDAVGPALYTLYIPENADVMIQSGGELRSATQFTASSGALSFAGNGIYFVGLQFPRVSFGYCGVTYCFTACEGEQGRVAIYNLDGSLLEERVVRENECFEATPTLIDSTKFVEIEHCKIEFSFSNNG